MCYTGSLTACQSCIGLHKLAPKLEDNPHVDRAVHLSDQVKQFPTISEITAATTAKVKAELEPLFVRTRKFLKDGRVKNLNTVPLFLLATGGMRRLKQQNYDSFAILKQAVINYINKSGFKEPKFDTIRGEDEGLYGWIAVNSADNLFVSMTESPRGFMEMGGESAQIAVSLTPAQYGEYSGGLKGVTLGQRRYVVFTKTWPGLGLESAWRRHEERLRESGSTLTYDPCLPKQYAYRLSGSDKIITGTGNFADCLKETITLLGCPDQACANGRLCIYRDDPINGDRAGCLLRDPLVEHTPLRFNQNQFRGASIYRRAMYGVFEEIDPLLQAGNGDPFGVFWNQVVTLSERNWEQLKIDRPDDHQYLHKAFFMAGLIMSTLFFGFGIAMPDEATVVGNGLAHERAQRALRKSLVLARAAMRNTTEVVGRLEVQIANDLAAGQQADTRLATLTEQMNGLLDAQLGPNAENIAAVMGAFLPGDERAAIMTQSHEVADRLLTNRLAVRDNIEACAVVQNRAQEVNRRVAAANADLAIAQAELLARNAAVTVARNGPLENANIALVQQQLYNTVDEVDWTLGYVVLKQSGSPRVANLSRHTWSAEDQFVPHVLNPPAVVAAVVAA